MGSSFEEGQQQGQATKTIPLPIHPPVLGVRASYYAERRQQLRARVTVPEEVSALVPRQPAVRSFRHLARNDVDQGGKPEGQESGPGEAPGRAAPGQLSSVALSIGEKCSPVAEDLACRMRGSGVLHS